MTISVSEGGTYKKSEAMWVSSGGEWIEVSTGGGLPDVVAEIEFVGTTLDGYIKATLSTANGDDLPMGIAVTLTGSNWADGRSGLQVDLHTQEIVAPGPTSELVFVPAFFPDKFKSALEPGTGWCAAEYIVHWDNNVNIDVYSSVLAVPGEWNVPASAFFQDGVFWEARPGTSNTVSLVTPVTTPTTLPHTYSFYPIFGDGYIRVYVIGYNFDLPYAPTQSGWTSTGELIAYQTTYEGGGGGYVYRQDAYPAVGAANPNEVVSLDFSYQGPFVRSQWEKGASAGGITAHDGTANNQPYSGWSTNYGINTLEFVCSSATYTPFDATMVNVGGILQITAPPNVTLNIAYTPPFTEIDGQYVPERVLTVVTDATGNASIPLVNFSIVQFANAGIYTIVNASNRPQVIVNGPVIVTTVNPYIYTYGAIATPNTVAYAIENTWLGAYLGTSTTSTSYAYRYYSATVTPDPVLDAYTWAKSGPDQHGIVVTTGTSPNFFEVSSPPVVGQPYPAETLVLSSADIPGFAPMKVCLVPELDWLQPGVMRYVTCGQRSANPPDHASLGPSAFATIYKVWTVEHLGA
jgi:hypothetical protein